MANSRHIESLEGRRMMAVDPSPQEQYLLELVNRARMNPAAELQRLLNSTDKLVQQQLTYYGVNRDVLAQQWSSLMPAPPLAWNSALGQSAEGHNTYMIVTDTQDYQIGTEASLEVRTNYYGYADQVAIAENIYGHARSVTEAHATLMVNWATGQPNGMYDPPFARNTIMSPEYREVGISVMDVGSGKQLGPMAVTQDFGRRMYTGPAMVGVIYDDKVLKDQFYTPGEGLGGLTVTATKAGEVGTFTTQTTSSGGYTLPMEPGTYDVTVSGPGLAQPMVANGVVVGSENTKLDLWQSTTTGGGGGGGTGAPDLSVSISAGAAKVLQPGKPAKVQVKVTNQGGTLAGLVTARVYFSTDEVIDDGDVALPALTVPASMKARSSKVFGFNVTAPTTLPGGNYYLLAKVDADGDANPSNNWVSAGTTTRVVPPNTNLVATLSGKPKVGKNRTLPVTLKLKNAGNSLASGTAAVTLAARPAGGGADISLGSLDPITLALKPNAATTVRRTLTLPESLAAGSYQLVVTVVPALSVAESSTADNGVVSAPFVVA